MTMLSDVEATIGQRIQAVLTKNRMSMRSLARELAVAQPTVFKWCHDMTEPQLQHICIVQKKPYPKSKISVGKSSPPWHAT